MQATRISTILFVSLLFSATASAQVFDSGPSEPALFTNVINLPGDDLPVRIGGVVGETTQLNVASGGSVGIAFVASRGSEVNISGGSVGDGFFAGGSEINISGGSVGRVFDTSDEGSVVSISGGSVGRNFLARSDSVINISGGSLQSPFSAFSGSVFNLSGRSFALNGVPLDIPNRAFTIVERDVTLSGRLADGSAFSFDLNSVFSPLQDSFASNATLTVTLVPEPDLLLGDCNHDGVVNFLDVGSFISIFSAADYLDEADVNQNGVVDSLDIAPFIELLSSQ